MEKTFQNTDIGLLIFRVFIGATMAFAHGLGKLPPNDQLVQGIASMGFPSPVVFAWAAALAEFAGGITIALGLFTRLSGFFLGITMAVAAFVVHAQDPFHVKELAYLYFFSCLLFIFTGAGKYSLDKIIRKKA